MATKIASKSWVEKTPTVCGGDPCIRKTRITVHGIIEWHQRGLSDEQIMESVPGLTAHDLEAAWEHYAKNREEIERILQEENAVSL